MSEAPRAVIGLPLFRQPRHLPEALDTLLGQAERRLAVVLVDDGGDPAVREIALRYAHSDARVSYVANDRRLGMVANWQRAFELATASHPDVPYFAWASDHDSWHPRWLGCLADALDVRPDAVAAYPHNMRMDADGRVLRLPWSFDTARIRDPVQRLACASRGMSAGDMVYALFRVDALRRAHVFRPVIQPDRLLLAELALRGPFVQVDEVLWRRRVLGLEASVARQRRTLFGDRTPIYSRTPWPLQHAAVLAWTVILRGGPGCRPLPRYAAPGLAARYLHWTAPPTVRRRVRKAIRRARRGRGAPPGAS